MPRSILSLIFFTLLCTGCSDNEAPPNVPTPDTSPPAVEQEISPDVPPPVAPMVVRYHCGPSLMVEAVYEGETATLVIAGETHALTQQAAASGARYGAADLQWHTKGDEAVLTGDGEMHVCLNLDDDDTATLGSPR